MSHSADNRSEERLTINKEFESFESFVAEYVSNISRSGVLIRTESPLPVGTTVNLKFTVLTNQVEVIEGAGKVVRIHADPPGMGIVFTELTKYSADIIHRLLTGAEGPAGADG